jgi:hypothetical protein
MIRFAVEHGVAGGGPLRGPRLNAGRSADESGDVRMIAVLCLLLALASGTAAIAKDACPLSSLTVGPASVGFMGFRIGDALGKVQKSNGSPTALQPEEGLRQASAMVHVAGRPVWLLFRQDGGSWVLSVISLNRTISDSAACWSRDSLVAAVKRKAPGSQYTPSRHNPEQPEASSEHPMYALDSSRQVVVLLKPSQGAVSVGRLEDLD